MSSTVAGSVPSKRAAASRPVPAFHGNNFIHSNPLPPVSNLPSFSYGSPQTSLPKPITIRDTRLAMTDLLEKADAAAKARMEAVALERKLADENAAEEKSRAAPQDDPTPPSIQTEHAQQQQRDDDDDDDDDHDEDEEQEQEQGQGQGQRLGAKSGRGLAKSNPSSSRKSTRDPKPASTRKRASRSQSAHQSQLDDVINDSEFLDGDETSLEIHRIIASAKNSGPEPSMLRNRSINIGMRPPATASETLKNPRSAMKGSREEALRPTARTRANQLGAHRTSIPSYHPVPGERDATFTEENQAIGLASLVASPRGSHSPNPYQHHSGIVSDSQSNRAGTPPDTNDGSSPIPIGNSTSSNHNSVKAKSSSRLSQLGGNSPVAVIKADKSRPQQSGSGWKLRWPAFSRPFLLLRDVMGSTVDGIRKTAAILAIFVRNLFGPMLNFLLLGFFIFGVTTLSYHFLHGTRTFSPPSTIPGGSSDTAQRLFEVERQLGHLFRMFEGGSKKWETLSKSDRDSKRNLEQQISSMRSVLSAYSSVSSALDKHTSTYKANQKATAAAIATMQAQVNAMDKSLKRGDAIANEYKLDSRTVELQLNTVKRKIESVTADIEKLKQSQSLTEKAIQTFESVLPKQIAAKLDPVTGKLIVAPELLRYLQSVLREEIDSASRSPRGAESTPAKQADVLYNWSEFLRTNNAKMRGFVGQISDEKWAQALSSGVIVSREDMLLVIRSELEKVQGKTESDNRDLVAQFVAEAEQAARNAVSSVSNGVTSAAMAAASQYVHGRDAHKRSSASQYGDALIQAALHQFSATILHKPDYALLARGTLIDPRLTSSTFESNTNSSGLSKVLSMLFRPGPNEPAHILTESTNVGDCWSFPQSSGQVAIMLAEDIIPSHVTIDHIPRGLSGDDTSAPREIEFWISIDNIKVREQLRKATSIALGEVVDSASTRQYVANGYVRVACFTYDIMSQYPVQTFELPVDLEKLGVTARRVSFRFLSNWGNKEYTSIYRVRVHGTLNDVERSAHNLSNDGEAVKPL